MLTCLKCEQYSDTTCRASGKPAFVHVLRDGCPLEKFPKPATPPTSLPSLAHVPATSDLWRELHRRPFAADYVGGDDSAWLRDWSARVPCGDCRMEWVQVILPALPPDFASRQAYFAWTVAVHNRVNRKLGRREWTADEAAAHRE